MERDQRQEQRRGDPAGSRRIAWRRNPLTATGRLAIARPRLTVVLFGLLTLAAAAGLPRLTLRTDGATIYPQGDPVVERALADRGLFDDPETVILLVSSRAGGPAVASVSGLSFLAELHRALAALPALDGVRVRSLTDLLEPPRGPQDLYVRAYLDELPRDDRELGVLLARARDHPLVDGLFLAPDGRAAALYLPLAGDRERLAELGELERWLADRRGDSAFDLRLTGATVAEARLGERVLADLSWLTPLMVAVIALLLLASLRTLGGTLATLAEVAAVLLWTVGAMAWSGVPVTLVTTILPVVLLAMAITDEIHLLEEFQRRLRSTAGPRPDASGAVAAAMVDAMAAVERPIVLTSLTTGLGFLSFLAAPIAPIRDFGLFTACGILLAMLLSFTLIPALVVLLPARWFTPPGWLARAGTEIGTHLPARPGDSETGTHLPARPGDSETGTHLPAHPGDSETGTHLPAHPGDSETGTHLPGRPGTAEAGWLPALLADRSRSALLAGLALVALLAPGIARLEVQDSWIGNFDPDSEIVAADRDFNRAFWGSYRFDVVLEALPGADGEAPFRRGDGLALLEGLTRAAEASPEAHGAVSHLVPFELVAGGWGEPLPVSALDPATLHRIAAWVNVIKRRVDLAQFLDREARTARLRLLVNSPDFQKGEALERALSSHLEAAGARPARLAGSPDGGVDGDSDGAVRYHFSGDLELAVEVVRAIVTTQLASVGWTLAGVAALLLVALGSPRRTLVVLAPVVAAAAVTFGALGYLGVPLGIATSMFAALTLGVGLDFALHFSHRYLAQREGGAAHPAAVLATLAGCGRALRWNAMVLACGFLVLTLSSLKPNHSLGWVLAGALATCYAMTLLLLPALLRPLGARSAKPAWRPAPPATAGYSTIDR